MIVLDTSVVSYIFNRDTRAAYYVGKIKGDRSVISFQSLEEIRFGVLKRGWGERRKSEIEQYLDQYDVVWPNAELVERCAYLRNECQKIGRPLATADAWIAATALMLGCSLASHDRDFSTVAGLKIIKAPT